MSQKKIIWISCIAGLLLIFGVLQTFLSYNENQSIDEGVHIAAGYSYLKTGDFRLNPEHPPLAKILSAAPLLFLDLHLPTEHSSWESGNQWGFAQQFLYKSGNDADTILRVARFPIILLSLLLGVLIAFWSYKLGGYVSSIVATALYISAPLFLTHGHYVTTDIPVALGIFASCYFFNNIRKTTSWKHIFLFSFAILFTITVKFSGLIIIPVLFVFHLFVNRSIDGSRKNWWTQLAKVWLSVALICVVGVLVFTNFTTNSFPNDPFHGQQRIELMQETLEDSPTIVAEVQKVLISVVERATFPAYPYIIGLFEFAGHFSGGHDSFFLGEHVKSAGPSYFPVAFFLKSRLGFVVLLSLFLVLFVKFAIQKIIAHAQVTGYARSIKKLFQGFTAEHVLLVITPIIFFGISLTSKVNIGVRHILPVFPFLFVGVAQLFSEKLKTKQILRYLLFSIVIITLLSGFLIFPHTMAYFSEAIGSPYLGHIYLRDSNLDWGQNLKYLKTYLDENGINEVCYSYFGRGDFTYEGIGGAYLPTSNDFIGQKNLNCVVAISVDSLFAKEENYSWLWKYTPTDIIAYGLYIYDLRKN